MNTPSSVSRRIQSSAISAMSKNYEEALIHFFPALDKTAKRRRPKDGVGSRIKKLLKEQEDIISAVGTGNMFRDFSCDGVTFEQAIYKFGRTSIAHEGELDPRLKITDSSTWHIGKEWVLPSTYVLGLIVGTVTARENKTEKMEKDIDVTIFKRSYKINDLWGEEDSLRAYINDVFDGKVNMA